jgi:hypothetical protein
MFISPCSASHKRAFICEYTDDTYRHKALLQGDWSSFNLAGPAAASIHFIAANKHLPAC